MECLPWHVILIRKITKRVRRARVFTGTNSKGWKHYLVQERSGHQYYNYLKAIKITDPSCNGAHFDWLLWLQSHLKTLFFSIHSGGLKTSGLSAALFQALRLTKHCCQRYELTKCHSKFSFSAITVCKCQVSFAQGPVYSVQGYHSTLGQTSAHTFLYRQLFLPSFFG